MMPIFNRRKTISRPDHERPIKERKSWAPRLRLRSFLAPSHSGQMPAPRADGHRQHRCAFCLAFPAGQQFSQPRKGIAVVLPRPPALLPQGPKFGLEWALQFFRRFLPWDIMMLLGCQLTFGT
jgi:hypothetical protein